MSHAVLSPSAASRWLACTPSARLEQQFPDSSGAAAEEGTVAHSLGELLIKAKLNLIDNEEGAHLWNEIKANEKHYNEAMEQHSDDYATYVVEKFAEAQAQTPDAQIFLEQKIDLTAYVPEGFGTGDAVIIADGTMRIIDLKYGKGVPVSVENNRQMMLYALGAIEAHEWLYAINTVILTIYQPRLDNIGEWEISVADLKQWGEEELKPKAKLAFEGMGDYVAGKHCRFCKAKGICKANAEYNLELAKYDFRDSALLTDAEVADILNRADLFYKWLEGVEAYALKQAVTEGKKWPGYKLVEGRSVRQYTDKDTIATRLLQHFSEDVVYSKDLRGITALEKLIGKKPFEELVGSYLVKPAGKPTLAPESDKRSELSGVDSAQRDFQDEDTDN